MKGGDGELVERLRGGDEAAFGELACRYHGWLVRLATAYVPGPARAEAVARDAWLGMLDDLDHFDGRVAVRSWLLRILVNRASRASGQAGRQVQAGDPAAGPGRFDATGGWVYPPQPWPEDAVERLSGDEARQLIMSALDELPPGPRRVVLLRDVAGLPNGEVCQLLGITEASQRILLHHGRARIRRALAQEAGRW